MFVSRMKLDQLLLKYVHIGKRKFFSSQFSDTRKDIRQPTPGINRLFAQK